MELPEVLVHMKLLLLVTTFIKEKKKEMSTNILSFQNIHILASCNSLPYTQTDIYL